MTKKILIAGTRGIPAQHGGFETFTEHFSLYLKDRDWLVYVYCQEEGAGPVWEDDWKGIHLIHIPVIQKGALGTIIFDWKSTRYAVARKIPVMTLGYNTALFSLFYRLAGQTNIINMDGIEWKRNKWSLSERIWLYINEKVGAWLGNHLVADHPEIKNHLAGFVSREKITVIPYTAELLYTANEMLLRQFNIEAGKFGLLVARAEPENSILEIVGAYTAKKRGIPLVVLGHYDPESSDYHSHVLDSGNGEVIFVGAIYDQTIVQALRFYTRFYVHGHTVGGTNPSLVEALAAGSPVLAHDNRFNRWVAGKGALYFSSEAECEERITKMIQDDMLVADMKTASRKQYAEKFTVEKVHGGYERLLLEKGY